MPLYTVEALDSIWLPASHWGVNTGTPALAVVGSNLYYEAYAMDAAAIEIIQTEFVSPLDYIAKAISLLRLYWTNLGAGSGDVLWQFLGQSRANAGGLNTNNFVTLASIAITAPAQNDLKISDLTPNSWIPTITSLNELLVLRTASDGSDTLANDAGFIGLEVFYQKKAG